MNAPDLRGEENSACKRVVVGADGSAGSLVAVRYAAVEAHRLGLPLEVVHVVPDPSPVVAGIDAGYALTLAEIRHIGRQILDEAVAVATEVSAGVQVHQTVARGDRASVLCAYGSTDHLVVLGNQRLPFVERLMTGTVLNPVASRSAGPVVVVPDTWSVERRSHDRIVVGVVRCEASSGLLWRAFREAAERRATLEILHAWELRIRYGKAHVDRADIQAWRGTVIEAMQPDVATCVRQFPDVDYRINAVHGQPAAALVGATERADLMILARRSTPLGHSHLGATGRAVLQSAHCPVEVVAPAAAPVWERDADLERGGELLAAGG